MSGNNINPDAVENLTVARETPIINNSIIISHDQLVDIQNEPFEYSVAVAPSQSGHPSESLVIVHGDDLAAAPARIDHFGVVGVSDMFALPPSPLGSMRRPSESLLSQDSRVEDNLADVMYENSLIINVQPPPSQADQQEMTCGICLEAVTVNTRFVYVCGPTHITCRACALRHAVTSGRHRSAIHRDDQMPDYVNCPICRTSTRIPASLFNNMTVQTREGLQQVRYDQVQNVHYLTTNVIHSLQPTARRTNFNAIARRAGVERGRVGSGATTNTQDSQGTHNQPVETNPSAAIPDTSQPASSVPIAATISEPAGITVTGFAVLDARSAPPHDNVEPASNNVGVSGNNRNDDNDSDTTEGESVPGTDFIYRTIYFNPPRLSFFAWIYWGVRRYVSKIFIYLFRYLCRCLPPNWVAMYPDSHHDLVGEFLPSTYRSVLVYRDGDVIRYSEQRALINPASRLDLTYGKFTHCYKTVISQTLNTELVRKYGGHRNVGADVQRLMFAHAQQQFQDLHIVIMSNTVSHAYQQLMFQRLHEEMTSSATTPNTVSNLLW